MKISIQSVIAEAQKELGVADDADAPWFRTLAYEAVREIGSGELNIKETDWSSVLDLSVEKPCDLISPIRLLLSKDKCKIIVPYISPDFIRCRTCENTLSKSQVVGGENSTHYYFSSDASEYIYSKLKYVCAPIDDCGNPIVDERAARAVKQYIAYMYLKRKRRMMVGDNAQVPQSEIAAEYDLWVRLRKEAMGRLKMLDGVEMKDFARTFMMSGITPSTFDNSLWRWWGNWAGR